MSDGISKSFEFDLIWLDIFGILLCMKSLHPTSLMCTHVRISFSRLDISRVYKCVIGKWIAWETNMMKTKWNERKIPIYCNHERTQWVSLLYNAQRLCGVDNSVNMEQIAWFIGIVILGKCNTMELWLFSGCESNRDFLPRISYLPILISIPTIFCFETVIPKIKCICWKIDYKKEIRIQHHFE